MNKWELFGCYGTGRQYKIRDVVTKEEVMDCFSEDVAEKVCKDHNDLIDHLNEARYVALQLSAYCLRHDSWDRPNPINSLHAKIDSWRKQEPKA